MPFLVTHHRTELRKEVDHSACDQLTTPCLPAVPPAAGIPTEVHETRCQKGDITVNTAALRYKVSQAPLAR